MQNAKSGNTVKVHYTGRLDDGTVFDYSRQREPLEFTIGKGHIIAGFEKAVIDMTVGEAKTVRIPCEDAYGARREELVATVERAKFPRHITPEVGMHLQLRQPDGMLLNVLITEVAEDTITIDANHPFAGKNLNFEIELLEVGVTDPGQKEG